MEQHWFVFCGLSMILLLVGCQPSEKMENFVRTEIASGIQSTQMAEVLVRTQVALNIFSTQTAAVPSTTPVPSATPSPSATSTLPPTDTPEPGAKVLSSSAGLYEGPGGEYPTLAVLQQETILQAIGQYDDCVWVKVITPDGQEGWVNTYDVSLESDCTSLPSGSFRPLNGAVILDRRAPGGLGELTVENGGGADGLVVVTDLNDVVLVAFYIRFGNEYTLEGIPDGNYRIYFTTGEEWDGVEKAFSFTHSYQRFDDILDFVTSASQFTIWTLTLQPVVGGTGETSSVNPDEFPDIK